MKFVQGAITQKASFAFSSIVYPTQLVPSSNSMFSQYEFLLWTCQEKKKKIKKDLFLSQSSHAAGL